MSRVLLLAAGVAVLAVLGIVRPALEDDGPRTTQLRRVAPFTRIENPGAVDVRVRVGGRRRVVVKAGAEVVDDVRTPVREGVLHVRFHHHGWGGSDVVVEATVPRLDGVELSGSGSLDADGIDARAFALRSGGSGDVRLAGRAERVTVALDGSGDADLSGLAVRRLGVTIGGSGDVRYGGRPAVTRRVDGSGALERAG